MLSHPILVQGGGGGRGEWNTGSSPQNINFEVLIFLKLLSNLTKVEGFTANPACLFSREHRSKPKHAHPYIIGFAG